MNYNEYGFIGSYRVESIETAPKDGSILLTRIKNIPVLFAWCDLPDKEFAIVTNNSSIKKFFFREEASSKVKNSGWRILMLNRDGNYSIHGNYEPINPDYWYNFNFEKLGSVNE